MRRHDAVEPEPAIGFDIQRQFAQGAFVDRNGDVRIGFGPAVPREVLAAGTHAGAPQPLDQGAGQLHDRERVAMEGTIADDAAAPPVEVEHRRKRKVDAATAQLDGEHETDVMRGAERCVRIALPQFAQAAHRRQAGKAFATALHAAALVVDGDWQRRLAQGMDFSGQPRQLLGRTVVAGKQDQSADARVQQALALEIAQLGPGDVDHQRAVRHFFRRTHAVSMTTKATA